MGPYNICVITHPQSALGDVQEISKIDLEKVLIFSLETVTFWYTTLNSGICYACDRIGLFS